MKNSLIWVWMVLLFLCGSGLLLAQTGPGWATSKEPTIEQVKAYFKTVRGIAPKRKTNALVTDKVVTETEAAASLAKRMMSPLQASKSGILAAGGVGSASLAAPAPTVGGNSADFITPEILNLAAGLNYDPVTIYEYVRNIIEYEDYFGSKKGAHLTLLEGSGNSFDQSALLVALLRASGYAPQYKYGPVAFTYTELVAWLGLDANPYSHMPDAEFLSTYGFSAATPAADIPRLKKRMAAYRYFFLHGYFRTESFYFTATDIIVVIPHVWVSVTVNGITYDRLSPSWKDSSDNSGIDLATAMGYSRTNFLAQAGGTVTVPDAVSGLNYTNLTNTLTAYSNTLTNYLKTNESSRAANRITGSRSIVRTSVSSLAYTRLVYTVDSPTDWIPNETWTAIPDVHISKLQISMGQSWNAVTQTFGTPLYDQTLNMTELRGRKLSLSFSGNTARLHLDETPVGAPATVTAANVQMRLSAAHHHYTLSRRADNTLYVSETGLSNQAEVKTYIKADQYAYAIVYSFGNPEAHLRKREEVLDGYRRAGLADTDWRVMTEVLNVMGLHWMHQTYLQDQVLAPLYRMLPLKHHRFGRVSQESSYYIDVGLQLSAGRNRISNDTESIEHLALSAFFSSAMEHSIIEQLQGENQNAVSTVKLLYLANQAGQRIYRATPANWSAINTAANLQNYSDQDKSDIFNYLATSRDKALIPQNAQITLNQWNGIGYALQGYGSLSMLINGNLYGGFNSTKEVVNSGIMAASQLNSSTYNLGVKPGQRTAYTPYTTRQFASTDPVDMASGAFFLDKEEMSIGSGASPRGIQFSRSYHSNRRYDKTAGLGYGWTHNYHMTANKRSSAKSGLGESISYHAVPFYVAAQVASDLYRNHSTAKEWMTATLVAQWLSDQIKYNAVAISMGNKTIEFIRMADGTYEPPANMNYTLTRSGSGATEAFSMTERHGSTYAFSPSGQISTITDLWGKTMSFTYAGTHLTKVTDAYGRCLTLTWTGDRITSVSDTNSRTASYAYTGDDLTGCTDVEGKVWSFIYDSQHGMTETKDPSNRTIARNVYDSENRVTEQYTFGDVAKRYDLTYTGFCNVEQNPQTGRTCYLYDSRSRGVGTLDPLVNPTYLYYDGHDRMITTRSPEADLTNQYFDRYNNLTRVNDPTNRNSYISYDTLQRPLTLTDKRGQVTTVNSYNPQHQPLQVTAPLNRITSTTYTAQGETDVITDPAGNTSDHDYNALGQLICTKVNGQVTAQFTYNSYGDVATATDALGQVTTMTYNKRRQLLATTAQAIAGQAAASISNAYNNEGMLLSRTDPRGNETSFTYSATAKPLTTTLPTIMTAGGTSLNNVVTQTYDSRDWPSSISNSLNHSSSVIYDAAQRAISHSDPLNRTTLTRYDRNARPKEVEDPLNRISKTFYSRRSEPTKYADPLSQETLNLYDENGNQTQLTNRRGKSYTMVYDAANRLSTMTTPTGKITSLAYKLNNLTDTITEPSGQVTSFLYDSRLRVQTKTDPVASTTYGYDLASNLKIVNEAGSVLSRNYDARNRLIRFTSSDGDLIKYEYDAANNLTKLTYPPDTAHPSGKIVCYTYNSRNQLESVTDWAGRVTRYQYDRLGKNVGLTRPNGTACLMELDAAGQIQSQRETSGGRLFHFQKFTYDVAGQITKKTTIPFAKPFTEPSTSATYDDDNRLLTVSGTPVTHDADGNMTSGPIERGTGVSPVSSALTYNSRNQLTTTSGISYTYDAEGRRRTLTDAIGTTRYTIDPNASLSRLLIKHQPDGKKTYYVYGLGLLYETQKISSLPEKTISYHYDQVGSTLARTDDVGKTIGRAEYSPYGQVTFTQGDMNTPFLYNGKFGVMTDPNGLLHMRARYYSPYLMRFLNADPIGFSGGSNWFAYADGNPISLNDPFGLCAESGWSQAGRFAQNFGQGLLNYTISDLGRDMLGVTQSIGDRNPWIGNTIDEINYNFPLEALGPNPGMFFEGAAVILGRGIQAAAANARAGQLVQTEFAFARGASIQTPGLTEAGETFVRVGATEASTGVRAGSYAMPEATFNALGRDPAVLKNALDLPGSAPEYFRYIRPPAGTPIQRGIVPGGQFGGVGGHPEVIFPKGIN